MCSQCSAADAFYASGVVFVQVGALHKCSQVQDGVNGLIQPVAYGLRVRLQLKGTIFFVLNWKHMVLAVGIYDYII